MMREPLTNREELCVRVARCPSDIRRRRYGTPSHHGFRDYTNPIRFDSREFRRVNHEFLRNLSLPFTRLGIRGYHCRVGSIAVAGLVRNTITIVHIQQAPCVTFPEEQRSECRGPYLLISPMFTKDVGRVHMAEEELKIDDSRCNAFACVVVGEGMMALP